jgi:hypothetical protein
VFLTSSATAAAQEARQGQQARQSHQGGGSAEQAVQSVTTITREYPPNNLTPWRLTETRSRSGDRELVIETFEVPGNEGKLRPLQETTVEIIRGGTRTRETAALFGIDGEGRRQLLERTESTGVTRPDGGSETVRNAFAADLNGRLALTSRRVEHTQSGSAGLESGTTLLRPDGNRTLVEMERTRYSERQIDPTLVRYDETHLIRDLNGRWQATEVRTGESRQYGPSQRLDEETVRRADDNGNLTLRERTLTRRIASEGRDEEVTETFAPEDGSSIRSGAPLSRLRLIQVVRRSTTALADGGFRRIEEVERRNPVAPSEPLRVIQRTFTTVRRAGPDRWMTEREVFELDVNGRFVPTIKETEEKIGALEP